MVERRSSGFYMKSWHLVIVIIVLLGTMYGNSLFAQKRGKDTETKANKTEERVNELEGCMQSVEADLENQKEKNENIDKFMESFHKWQLKDAEWKGSVGEAIGQSMYYGKTEKISEIEKLYKENKKTIEPRLIGE